MADTASVLRLKKLYGLTKQAAGREDPTTGAALGASASSTPPPGTPVGDAPAATVPHAAPRSVTATAAAAAPAEGTGAPVSAATAAGLKGQEAAVARLFGLGGRGSQRGKEEVRAGDPPRTSGAPVPVPPADRETAGPTGGFDAAADKDLEARFAQLKHWGDNDLPHARDPNEDLFARFARLRGGVKSVADPAHDAGCVAAGRKRVPVQKKQTEAQQVDALLNEAADIAALDAGTGVGAGGDPDPLWERLQRLRGADGSAGGEAAAPTPTPDALWDRLARLRGERSVCDPANQTHGGGAPGGADPEPKTEDEQVDDVLAMILDEAALGGDGAGDASDASTASAHLSSSDDSSDLSTSYGSTHSSSSSQARRRRRRAAKRARREAQRRARGAAANDTYVDPSAPGVAVGADGSEHAARASKMITPQELANLQKVLDAGERACRVEGGGVDGRRRPSSRGSSSCCVESPMEAEGRRVVTPHELAGFSRALGIDCSETEAAGGQMKEGRHSNAGGAAPGGGAPEGPTEPSKREVDALMAALLREAGREGASGDGANTNNSNSTPPDITASGTIDAGGGGA